MSYLQKIYFDRKPLIFTDSINDFINYNEKEAITYSKYSGATTANILFAQEQLNNSNCPGILIEESNQALLNILLPNIFTAVIAAGGAVCSPENKILLIHRRGAWDLPKGKLDDGESIPECAVREVIEETGLPNEISLGEELYRSYHVYSFKGENILKTTHWFAMKVSKEWPLQPQAEEDITEATWLTKAELSDILDQTWPTIREVLLMVTEIKY